MPRRGTADNAPATPEKFAPLDRGLPSVSDWPKVVETTTGGNPRLGSTTDPNSDEALAKMSIMAISCPLPHHSLLKLDVVGRRIHGLSATMGIKEHPQTGHHRCSFVFLGVLLPSMPSEIRAAVHDPCRREGAARHACSRAILTLWVA